MHKRLYVIFLSLWFVCFVIKTQAQTYPFTNLTLENGLSQGQILSVFQDDEGVMWFGTNGGGITKFDGLNFEYITNKEGLAGNVVFCIAKNTNGQIYVGTDNGLSIYNPQNKLSKKFTNYTTKNGLSDNRIFCILFNEDNSVFLGTSKGISILNNTTCSIKKINEKLDSSSIFHLLKDSKNNLWCSTLGNGIFKVNDYKTVNYTTKDGLTNSMVFGVTEYSKDTFWFLTGEGLCEFKNEKIKQINPGDIDNSATYYSYCKDSENNLWLATSLGIIKISKNNNYLVFKKQNGLVDNSIWKIMQDKESNLWFASDQNGISKLISERFFNITTKDGILLNAINSVYQNKQSEYWIGSKNGLSRVKNGETINYNNTDLAHGSSLINTIIEDRNGNYLIGTGNGLVIYDGKKFNRILNNDKESQLNAIYDIYCDDIGTIWLGTQIGIAQINNGYIKAYTKSFVTNTFVYKIFQDTKGVFWFGAEDGLYKFDGSTVKHFTEKDDFTQKRVCSIIADKKNNLWFATSNGLYKYDGAKFNIITDKDGLASNDVLSVVIDKKGVVWAGFSTGIDKITEQNGTYKIKHYGIEDGFMGQECSQNAMIINNEGNLVVGTSKGLMFYQDQFDRENLLEPITKLKSIDLFFQKTEWVDYSDSVSINNIPYNLKLPYDKNYLTFNFIGVSLTTPDKVSYKYMLKGIDKGWRFSTKTEATYSNISPGNYEFILYANNGENVWNKEPLVFKFKIAPPFWRTWWFYSIVLIIILSGIYSYFKIRTANKKIVKQNLIIEEKNGALQYANKEIAEKNQNITDSINYAKRIQQSFLTSDKILKQTLNDYFILFKPRDIVSGDFYLAFNLPDRTIVACSDCTGHGIPGAFMSLIGISLLNEIIFSKGILDTAKILEELRNTIIKGLNPEKNEAGGKDGMDISLISIFKQTDNESIKINFSGANNSMYLISNKTNMQEFKGDKQPVGYYSNMKPFTQQEINAKKGDTIYLFTDGFADQFGGKSGKKFMSKQLKELLLQISSEPLQQQATTIFQQFTNWQGKLEQVDDVTVIGIKLL